MLQRRWKYRGGALSPSLVRFLLDGGSERDASARPSVNKKTLRAYKKETLTPNDHDSSPASSIPRLGSSMPSPYMLMTRLVRRFPFSLHTSILRSSSRRGASGLFEAALIHLLLSRSSAESLWTTARGARNVSPPAASSGRTEQAQQYAPRPASHSSTQRQTPSSPLTTPHLRAALAASA